jgi:hypothetical protein
MKLLTHLKPLRRFLKKNLSEPIHPSRHHKDTFSSKPPIAHHICDIVTSHPLQALTSSEICTTAASAAPGHTTATMEDSITLPQAANAVLAWSPAYHVPQTPCCHELPPSQVLQSSSSGVHVLWALTKRNYWIFNGVDRQYFGIA